MRKFDYIFNDIERPEQDERIINLKNKIYSEQLGLIYFFSSIYYLYKLMIVQESSIIILIILIGGIYEDFRLAYNQAYISNKFSKIIIFFGAFLGIEYLYRLIFGVANFIIISIISLILSNLYSVILRCLNDKNKSNY